MSGYKPRWFNDKDGVRSIFKDPDSDRIYAFKVLLGKDGVCADKTISDATFVTQNGLTVGAISFNALGLVSLSNVEGTGEAIITITTNLGETIPFTRRFKDRDR